jgi:hypothetical protein
MSTKRKELLEDGKEMSTERKEKYKCLDGGGGGV